MKLKFKFITILCICLIESNCIIETKSATKDVSNETPLQKVKKSLADKQHYYYASFPFRRKSTKVKIPKQNTESNTNSENNANSDSNIKPKGQDSETEFKEPLEEWFMNLDNCSVVKVAKNPDEKQHKDAEDPHIEVLLYDKSTGEYSQSIYGGYEFAYYYDPVNNNIFDENPELGFGFKIDDKFISREYIGLVDIKQYHSVLQMRIIKGDTFGGMVSLYAIYDSVGPNKKIIMTVQCHEKFLYKTKNQKNSQKLFGTIWAIGLMGLGLFMSL